MISVKMYRKLDQACQNYQDRGILDCNKVYGETVSREDKKDIEVRNCFLVAMWLLSNKQRR